jgi:hypothetical protein
MGLNPYGPKGIYTYADDKGNAFSIRMYQAEANAGGFVATAITNAWPYGRKNLRMIEGVTAAGQRIRLPVASLGAADWEVGTTFTVAYPTGTRTFAITGYKGERKDARKLA